MTMLEGSDYAIGLHVFTCFYVFFTKSPNNVTTARVKYKESGREQRQKTGEENVEFCFGGIVMSGIVGIKVPKDSPIARCVSVIRKLEPSMAISEINSRIKNDEYVLTCDYIDDSGIKKIIKCYDGLIRLGIEPKIFEHDDECDIQFIRNLNQTYDEIGEEIDEEMDEVFENDDMIFEYKLSNAWLFPIVSLRVFDRATDNVKCMVWYSTGAPQDLALTKNYSLDGAVIKQISDTICQNSDVFKIEEVEFPPVLDGFSNEFYFRYKNGIVRVDASNISAWNECSESIDGEDPVNAMLILKVFTTIKTLLTESGVDSRYLSLEWQ